MQGVCVFDCFFFFFGNILSFLMQYCEWSILLKICKNILKLNNKKNVQKNLETHIEIFKNREKIKNYAKKISPKVTEFQIQRHWENCKDVNMKIPIFKSTVEIIDCFESCLIFVRNYKKKKTLT